MSPAIHNKHYHFTLYSVIDRFRKVIYIGKSKSKNPRARFSAHLRGEYRATYYDFGPGCEDDTEPEFIVLEILDCSTSVAYRHTIAWCHFFEENGWCTLTSYGATKAAENLHPETAEIYNQVCLPHTLEYVLSREVVEHPEEKPEVFYTPPLRQFNLRLREDVIDCFRIFCSERDLTQSEALRMLLLSNDFCKRGTMIDSYQRDMALHKETINKLRAELDSLREKRDLKKRTDLQRCQDWASVVRQILDYIIDRHPNTNRKQTLKCKSFKSAKRNIDFASYKYPEAAGVSTITLDALVYGCGRHPALFVLGQTELDDTLIKLRWYAKAAFVGIPPRAESFAVKGSKWLMGHTPALDGAMDLIAAIPFHCLKVSESETRQSSKESRSLDKIISTIESIR